MANKCNGTVYTRRKVNRRVFAECVIRHGMTLAGAYVAAGGGGARTLDNRVKGGQCSGFLPWFTAKHPETLAHLLAVVAEDAGPQAFREAARRKAPRAWAALRDRAHPIHRHLHLLPSWALPLTRRA